MTGSRDAGATNGASAKAEAPALTEGGQGEGKDEKLLRRRLQYKLHQRRHRAKQKQKAVTLEHEVQTLQAEVEALTRRRQKLLVESNWFSSRGTSTGVPARVAMEYFRLFEVGGSPITLSQQEQYLRSVMTADTEGPDYLGVDTVVVQWRRYASFFAYTRFEPVSIDVSTVSDLTVVEVSSYFHIRAHRDCIAALYPSLLTELELMQKVMEDKLSIMCKYRFVFDSRGIVTWFSAEWDLIGALQRTLGSLADVSAFLSGANISAATGQISVEESRPASAVDPRHNVDFLLS
ncbi:hypothetical protein BBJ28_00002987 [Nothophytophthora sp. Chile5]|nr:hypothetical protein BBJ28_00002987 [Nothophytophthora sp. Chile5]